LIPTRIAFAWLVTALGWVWISGVPLADTVILASWNVENLGKRGGQSPGGVAEQILLSGADLVALQEIWDLDGEDGTASNPILTRAMRLLGKSTGSPWRYLLFPGRDPTTPGQHCGVAWNTGKLTLVGRPHRIQVAYANADTWKRHPYAVQFRAGEGKTDFVAIVLHMKSNDKAEEVPTTPGLRQQEAEALVARLGHVRRKFHDDDIVLLGDSNCLDHREPALRVFRRAGFRDLNARDALTYKKKSAERPVDRILVPSDQLEFRSSRQYVLRPSDPSEHRRRLSDHWLVLAAVTVLPDDD
jgi:endonuclease/exonuclease/phosphatase family metal-dependent hydrolase